MDAALRKIELASENLSRLSAPARAFTCGCYSDASRKKRARTRK